MMQAMPIHPRDRFYVDSEGVIHDSYGLHEPFLIVERTMSDSQMKNVGQIQPGEKPAKDKIDCPDQQTGPRSQMSRGGIHTSQQVANNNQIADEVVDFHDGSPASFERKSGSPVRASTESG